MLLAWIRTGDSPINRNAKILLEFRLKLPVNVPTNLEKRTRAMYGFRALGPAAKPAFPALVAIVLNSPDDWQRGDAINALTGSDEETIRRLAAGLKSPDRAVRLRAVFALSCLRIAPEQVCYPALEGALKDVDPQVRARADEAIAMLDRNLNTFSGWLTHRDPDMRVRGAKAIGYYRTRADAYLTNLEAAAGDDDPRVRAAVAAAVRQVRGLEPPRSD
jgi:HEAT repeat protein